MRGEPFHHGVVEPLRAAGLEALSELCEGIGADDRDGRARNQEDAEDGVRVLDVSANESQQSENQVPDEPQMPTRGRMLRRHVASVVLVRRRWRKCRRAHVMALLQETRRTRPCGNSSGAFSLEDGIPSGYLDGPDGGAGAVAKW